MYLSFVSSPNNSDIISVNGELIECGWGCMDGQIDSLASRLGSVQTNVVVSDEYVNK